MKKIIKYQLSNGKIPFDEWFYKLDKTKQAKVLVRIQRLTLNNLGDYRNLTNELTEIKFKSGERIYISIRKEVIIILLNAGNKQRQNNDIQKAKLYIEDYKERFENNDDA